MEVQDACLDKCTAERETELLGGRGTLPGSYNLKKIARKSIQLKTVELSIH